MTGGGGDGKWQPRKMEKAGKSKKGRATTLSMTAGKWRQLGVKV